MERFWSEPSQKVGLGLGFAVTLGLVVTAACGGSDCSESFTCPPDDGSMGGQGGAEGAPSCERDNGGCHAQANCSLDGGAVQCTCLDGYAGDGFECTDVDECAENNGGCGENATCANAPGTRQCSCDEGYHGDGLTCRPLTELITVGVDGSAANGDSYSPCFSANGRYLVFNSMASNLVATDTNGSTDVFRYDVLERTILRVSLTHAGAEANGVSTVAGLGTCPISENGRYVAFSSRATNLVTSDTNEHSDIFVRDIEEGSTVRVSVGANGTQANADSLHAVLSADGTRILFISNATNLGAGSGAHRLYLRDSVNAQTELLSVSESYAFSAYRPTMNAQGTVVAADSTVMLDTSQPSGTYNVFLRTGETPLLVSHAHGQPATSAGGNSRHAVLTPDARFIAFQSDSANLLPPGQDTNGSVDVFLRNLMDGSLERISLSAISTEVTGDSTFPSLSADGRYVLFHSVSNELVAGDSNEAADVFLRDRVAETTIRVSVGSKGEQADGPAVADSLALSSDGRQAAFGSQASNLAPGVTGGWQQLYLRTLPAPAQTPAGD
jgi:Tol biopolymer transport system component